jgi:hypothetical protein
MITRIWIGVLFFMTVQYGLQAQIISYGSEWRYFDLAMAPPNQGGDNWKEIEYDDSTWEEGPAHLGYGDGDEATVINSSTLTAYYRHIFSVADPSDFSQIKLFLTYDDGAVVYLNGAEVWRVNMPGGTITYNTFAASSSADNAQANTTIANSLLTGENIIAIEVHQRSASSSDLSFDFSLFGIPANGVAVVTRGPYLQRANNNTVVVRWRTNINSPSILDCGTSLGNLNNTTTDATLKTEHVLTIDSLTAATKYYYRIRNATDTLVFPNANTFFKTYPTPGDEAPLTAWLLGDCGSASSNARNVRNAYYNYIDTNHTDMILLLGDNAYDDGTDAEYQTALFENMYGDKLRNSVLWACLGNHDGHTANSSTQTGPYYDIFTFPKLGECGGEPSGTEAYYSFDHGNVHFVILDSYETDRTVGGNMYDWLEEDLQNTTAYWIVAFWHHPPYSKGDHNSDTDAAMKQMRENFNPLFETYGVDLILGGHSHSYERTFLINGHYGLAASFNPAIHTVGTNGDESGQPELNETYYKAPVGPESGAGTVYTVTGSAGKLDDDPPLNHNAMYYDAASLGSSVLKINGDTLSLIYLRQNGNIDDHFTIIKDSDCAPGIACNDLDSCTVNDTFDNFCYCIGEHNRRYVTNMNDSGAGSLREAINTACTGDTIRFTSTVTDTINITSDIIINKSLVIEALPGQQIAVSGQHMTRIFEITVASVVTFSNITLHGGQESVNGGAVLNHGSLLLENTTFVNNTEGVIPKAWTNHGLISAKVGTTYVRIE